MLVFIDESYDKAADGTIRHALAGFGIAEADYRSLVVAVHQIKERYFTKADGLSTADLAELRKTKIACSGEPRRAELKASKLLTRSAAIYHEQTGRAQSILLVEELLDQVFHLGGVVFGVLSEPDHVDQIQNPGGMLPLQLKALAERVEAWMAEDFPEEHAILVFDAIDNRTSQNLNRCMSDFLFRHSEGKRMRHLVPTPFWVDSEATPGSQVADIIAHVLMNSMLTIDRRKPLGSVWRRVSGMQFNSQTTPIRGIRRLKKKQQTGA